MPYRDQYLLVLYEAKVSTQAALICFLRKCVACYMLPFSRERSCVLSIVHDHALRRATAASLPLHRWYAVSGVVNAAESRLTSRCDLGGRA